MKADSNLFKILSIFGAGLAIFLAFVNGGSAGILISTGHQFNGVCTIFSAIGWVAVAALVYLNYQKKTRAEKPGKKIEDLD